MSREINRLLSISIQNNHRAMFVIPNSNINSTLNKLYSMLSEKSVFAPECIWVYENTIFEKKKSKSVKTQPIETESEELTIPKERIRSYTTTAVDKLLGSTIQMLVIENVLDPHVLAKTIETVKGTGIIVIILGEMHITEKKFLDFFKMHRRKDIAPFENQMAGYFENKPSFWSHDVINTDDDISKTGQFSLYNHRLFQSFKRSNKIILLNDKMKIINQPVSSDKAIKQTQENTKRNKSENDCDPLYNMCVTEDQEISLKKLSETLLTPEKTLSTIIADRGRGKSALLGLAIVRACAGQLNLNASKLDFAQILKTSTPQETLTNGITGSPIISYKHVHVIAQHIENVSTIFEFIILGLKKLGFKENRDYEIKRVFTNRSYVNEVVVYGQYNTTNRKQDEQNFNSFKRYPLSTITYYSCVSRAVTHPDLLVIDEASTIPFSTLHNLLKANKVLLASTMGGYEGTGRAIYHKFLKQIEDSMNQPKKSERESNRRNNTQEITFEKIESLQLSSS
ncbi:putative P-loop ATPase fused to an acetyltransferase, partial [Pseudoloma neurophilia]